MSFMSPQIWTEDFYSLETDSGTETVPVSVSGVLPPCEHLEEDEGHCADCLLDHFGDYIEGSKIQDCELVEGKYLFRLSASGYMDCTETSYADSEEEAIEEILEMYGNDDCPEDWEEELTERLSELRGESEE